MDTTVQVPQKLVFDSSVLVHDLDANKIFFKTSAGAFKLSGAGIVCASRMVIDSFKTAAFPNEVINSLSTRYDTVAIGNLIDFFVLRRVLITYDEFIELANFDLDFKERYMVFDSDSKKLPELYRELQTLKIGIIGTYQFVRCMLLHLEDDRMFGPIACLITDREEIQAMELSRKAEVSCFGMESEEQVRSFVDTCSFVICASSYETHALFRLVNTCCLEKKIRWLRVVIRDEQAEIGPLFIPGETCCYSCMERRAIGAIDNIDTHTFTMLETAGDEFHDYSLATASSYYLTLLTADITLYALIRFFAGLDQRLCGSVMTLFAESWKTSIEKIFRYSQCESCRLRE